MTALPDLYPGFPTRRVETEENPRALLDALLPLATATAT